jgi:hypothetical protein
MVREPGVREVDRWFVSMPVELLLGSWVYQRACRYARGLRIRMEQRQQTRGDVPVILGIRGGRCPSRLGV